MFSDESYTWYWYAYRDSPIQLDQSVYPSLERIDGLFPIPQWVCVGPNKSLHLDYNLWSDNTFTTIHLKSLPLKGKQYCRSQYGITLLDFSWIDMCMDMVQLDSYRLLRVLCGDVQFSGWVGLVTRSMPRIRSSTEIVIPACPTCGTPERYKPTSSRCWLDSRDWSADVLFSTWDGLFLRSDVADLRCVTPPKGAFRYSNRLRFK